MRRYIVLRLLAIVLVTTVGVGCGAPEVGETGVSSQRADPDSLEGQAAELADSMGALMIAPNLYQLPQIDIPEDPEEKAKMQAQLVARWREVAKTHKENPRNPECMVIALQLSEFGNEAVLPLVDVIGDPEEDPYIKVLAVECLKQLANEVMIDPLMPLTDPACDGTTRACATLLLGQTRKARVMPTLRKLTEDPERRVRFSAIRGLALYGDRHGRKAFADLWDDPQSSISEREQIARMFVNDVEHDKANVEILVKILRDAGIGVYFRRLAVAALGRGAQAAAVPALKAAAEKDPDPRVREVAASAASAIERRIKVRQEKQDEEAPAGGEPSPPAAQEAE